MARIPDSFLTELQYRADAESTIGSYVELKRSGRMLKGLCPFHGERTPSFYVYPESQSFYCFGCGAGGGIIQFIQRIENLSFVEAVKFLAQRAGLNMPDETDDTAGRLRMRVLEANRLAARYFFDNLSGENGAAALDYLRKRGLSPGTIRRFGLGFAPEGWSGLMDSLKRRGFSEGELMAAGLISEGRNGRRYDVFRERIMFPIIDLRGSVIAFGGRLMGEGKGPKYLNTNDTPAFKKSRNLYALNLAKAHKGTQLVLAEGYMDVIALHQAGFDNAVATLGTALTPEQARLIGQYAAEVIIAYDSDAAGRRATRRASDIFDQIGMRVRVLDLGQSKDPDEYIKKHGPERFARLLSGSSSATEYEIARLKEQHDISTGEGKIAYIQAFCQLISALRNPVERDVYVSMASAESGVAREAILSSIEEIKSRKRREQERKADRDLHLFSEETPARREDPQRMAHRRAAVAEDRLIRLMLKNPDYAERVMGEMSAGDAVTELNGRIFKAVFDKIAAGEALSVTAVTAALDDMSTRHLGWLLATGDGVAEGLSEALDYVATIKSEREKAGHDPTTSDPEALREYIETLKKNKI